MLRSRLVPSLAEAVLYAICLTIASHAFAGEDRTFDSIGRSIAAEVTQVLVDGGVCARREVCSGESRVLFASGASGLAFEVYGLQDSKVISKALTIFGQRGLELPVGKQLEASIIANSKSQDLKRSPLSKQPVLAKLEVHGMARGLKR